MARFSIIPVFILTRDRRAGFELKRYLEEEAGFPVPVVGEVYLSPRELVPHLSLYDTNFIVSDYNNQFIDDLVSLLEEPANLVYDHQIILRSPSEHFLAGDYFPGNDGFPVIRDYHDYPSVASTIKSLLKSRSKSKGFTEANYLVAGLLMMLVIVLTIIIL